MPIGHSFPVSPPTTFQVIRRDIDPQAVATLVIATLEGGILLAQAHGSPVYLQHTADHLLMYVRRDVAA